MKDKQLIGEYKKRYACIKDITKALKSNFKGIQANSYGYCCNSDYSAFHSYINENDFIGAKIYKGGLNNNYHNGYFEIYKDVYYTWKLTYFKLDDVIKVMESIAIKFNAKVIKPKNNFKCITLSFSPVNGEN